MIQQEVESVYYKIIDKIIDTVKVYVRRASASCQDANQNLRNFFDFFSDHTIRYYTLNYDELVNGFLDAFNGFDLRENSEEYYKVNPQRIIKESDGNCNFNLHGSIHYFAEQAQVGLIYWPKLVRRDDYDYTFGRRYIPSEKDQDKKPLLLSPIITGFNKPSRVLFEPMSYFFHAFQRDCFQADIIMTMGYSFSDIHINQWIQSALNFGKCKFVWVDCTNGEIKYISEEILLPKDYRVNDLSMQNNGLFYNEQKKGYFYWKGINDFVKDQEAWKIIKE